MGKYKNQELIDKIKEEINKGELDRLLGEKYHPGEYIEDYLEYITLDELTRRVGVPKDYLIDVIAGRRHVTDTLAKRLEPVTGVSKLTWINLQETYNNKVYVEKLRKSDKQVKEGLTFPITIEEISEMVTKIKDETLHEDDKLLDIFITYEEGKTGEE